MRVLGNCGGVGFPSMAYGRAPDGWPLKTGWCESGQRSASDRLRDCGERYMPQGPLLIPSLN